MKSDGIKYLMSYGLIRSPRLILELDSMYKEAMRNERGIVLDRPKIVNK